MRRHTMLLLFSLALLPRLTDAQPVCFQASPFVDRFTFTVEIQSFSPLQASLTAEMTAPGLYQMGGAGVLLVSTIDPVGAYALRVPMANLGSFFGGNAVCALTATVSPTTTPLTGTWRLTCTGTLDPFTVPGTMAQITCPVVFPTTATKGGTWSVLAHAAAQVAGSMPETPLSVEEVLVDLHRQGVTAVGEDVNNAYGH